MCFLLRRRRVVFKQAGLSACPLSFLLVLLRLRHRLGAAFERVPLFGLDHRLALFVPLLSHGFLPVVLRVDPLLRERSLALHTSPLLGLSLGDLLALLRDLGLLHGGLALSEIFLLLGKLLDLERLTPGCGGLLLDLSLSRQLAAADQVAGCFFHLALEVVEEGLAGFVAGFAHGPACTHCKREMNICKR